MNEDLGTQCCMIGISCETQFSWLELGNSSQYNLSTNIISNNLENGSKDLYTSGTV